MNVCPANVSLTLFMHTLVPRRDRCLQLVEGESKYEIRKVIVPEWVDPALEVGSNDPRNVRILDRIPAERLEDAIAAVAELRCAGWDVPVVHLEKVTEEAEKKDRGYQWVLLGDDLQPITGLKSALFVLISGR